MAESFVAVVVFMAFPTAGPGNYFKVRWRGFQSGGGGGSLSEHMDFKPKHTNLVTMLENSIRDHGSRPVFGVRKEAGWEWVTYKEFGDTVDKLRAGIASLGIAKGDKVACISNNKLEWVVGQFASFGAGTTWVPMYEQQLDKEWEFILKDSGSSAVFVANSAIRDRVEKLKANVPSLKHILTFDGTGPNSYAGLIEAGAKTAVPSIKPADTDVATFIYTSGTTGNPKGVKLSHFNLAANVSSAMSVFPLSPDDRSLAFLPWAHVAGGSSELHGVIAVGGSTAICEKVDQLITLLPEVKPTFLFAVPRVWNRVYDNVHKKMEAKPAVIKWIFRNGIAAAKKKARGESPSFSENLALTLANKIVFPKIVAVLGGRLKYAISGAAALSPDVAQFIDTIGVKVYEGYGLTETSSAVTANTPGNQRIGSVGKPLPGSRVVLDKSKGNDGEQGEIIAYGHAIMMGYHNLPEATKESMTEDGGLRTGDLGKLDADGYLFITGRVKEIYKLENGKYVAPAPIEEKITLSPFIIQTMVHGANHAHNVALVVPDFSSLEPWAKEQGITGSREELCRNEKVRAHIASEIEKYLKDPKTNKGFERIVDFVLIAEEMTPANDMLTPTLKMKRRNVMTKYGAALEALYGKPGAASATG